MNRTTRGAGFCACVELYPRLERICSRRGHKTEQVNRRLMVDHLLAYENESEQFDLAMSFD